MEVRVRASMDRLRFVERIPKQSVRARLNCIHSPVGIVSPQTTGATFRMVRVLTAYPVSCSVDVIPSSLNFGPGPSGRNPGESTSSDRPVSPRLFPCHPQERREAGADRDGGDAVQAQLFLPTHPSPPHSRTGDKFSDTVQRRSRSETSKSREPIAAATIYFFAHRNRPGTYIHHHQSPLHTYLRHTHPSHLRSTRLR